ncbi:Telomerase reverse transcriptase [Raphanus sativus]|uniref:Telomerase reverse transcriptase n=1 Tax=Raphanus sativus TaxID=3726 RepID=A0A6J0M8I2_RAPSA|nr:telomerase reverse transcriptase [Raphanus sativus]KAJ4914737.1 Telomerase reverse transcriptase [Raphanus sativus]
MARKPRRNVPESLRSLFGEKARNLKDAIVDLITRQSIQPEQCRCKGQGCLGCSRDKPSFLLRPDDPNHYRQLLLHRCFVVLHEQAPPLPRFSPTSWWSQREIVEKVIETGGDSGKNVICARYDKYEQTSPVLELLITSSWEFLLNRIGHDLMVYLLRHTSIFLPFQGKNHQQVSGPPLRITQNETLPVHNNKRKSDESVNPSKKRQRVSSTVSDCPKDKSAAVTSKASVDVVDEHREEKPKKRFRLYLKRRQKQRRDNCPNVDDEATCETSCTNGEASTGNEADGRNQKISTSGSLTDFTKQAKQVKGNKHFKFSNSEYVSVIPPNHILKTLKANYSDSKSLMNHIFGEVSAWSAAPSHGKGNCPSGSICLYHSLLNSLKSLIGKTKSSYLKTLLDKHCPVLLPQESASANAASQSSGRQNSDKLPHGSSSEKNKPNSHNVGERLYCTKDQVVYFIWAICSHIIPEGLLGTKHQMRVLLSNIAWLVSRRRNEKCTVTQFLHKVKPSGFPFFAKKQLCCMVSGHALQNESISSTQQMLCTKWISWLFLEIVKKVGLFNFYATERQDGRQNIYYYRKCNWEKLVRKEISKTLNGYVQVDNAEAESRREKFELSKYRFLPKGNGARMLLDFSSSSRSPSLRDVHSVLKDIQLKEPDVLGSSVFDHDDFYRNLGPYLKDLRSQSGELPPLFLVVADVRKAFDSIDQGKLLDIVQCVLKDEHILKKCRLVCRGKRSRWVNNILVSTDKNDTVARFTSTFPYNGLQSIIVDQGQNHLVRKNDVMHWINDMLKNNMVQIDKNFYVQIAGIPQGHKLSSLLCSFYYGHLERTFMYPFLDQAFGDASAEACNGEKELITSPSYKLLRFIDDYLFVSTSREQATRFYQRLKQGFPDYNCSMNYKKFCINFEDGVESQNSSNTKRMYVGGNGVSFIRWTGLLINSRTFEVQADYTRYASGHISSTFTVAWQNQPVGNLRHKLCYFLVPKCHPILFDSNINSGATVRLNIYQTFLLAAMKCHCYLYELARFWKVPPQNLSKFITRSIRYMFKLIQRKTHRINTGSSFRPVLKLRKEEVMWLGLHAYVQVLKRKHSRYRTLLNYLGSALLKLDLPLDLSPDLEYATNRSNSSILWDLSY